MHVTIMEVNQAEKDDYVKKNGMDSLNKRKLLGYIQDLVQTEPLSIVFYNKASLEYYHLYASRNPGIFIDYTGQLIKPVPPYLCAKYQDNQNDYKKILNALITMPSGSGPNAPPIDILELVTNDLTASNL
nr:9535_t:CDS:1 [Entrophospora candida]